MDIRDRIRAFNRFYTARLGVLGRDYLKSGLGLTEVRILHDLALRPSPRARALARDLGLDEGQLSRTLKTFERKGWLNRAPAADDARQRELRLTAEGETLARRLREASRDEIGAMLSDLSPGETAALAEAVGTAERLLGQRTGAAALRDLRPGDAGWIIARHGQLYAEDEGFDGTFEALVAEILAGFLRGHDPARERGWIAEREGTRLGSIFCVRESGEVAKLRLFFVERTERGTGLAQEMLDACLAFARAAGYRKMRLWTHESHRAAGRLYARTGFAMTDARPARSFGQDVVEQEWQREL
jgi:DNA-binding MarR family transcriptional regulator/N-acetylglutamate synthase-like GNAT family acetyltransferase